MAVLEGFSEGMEGLLLRRGLPMDGKVLRNGAAVVEGSREVVLISVTSCT
jgi:hypothetical protein